VTKVKFAENQDMNLSTDL